MPKNIPIFYSAILLTLVNLLLRFVGTTFQVYISSVLGAAGVGLLQLTMSVGSLALVAGTAGVRTAAMYLTAGELGRKKPENVIWVLSGCFLYSIAFSGCISLLLYAAAPWIAEQWIGNSQTTDSLRLFAAFLPLTCLCGVMTGYFTAANRIATLAAVEVAEQLCSMTTTLSALIWWAGSDPGKACMSVILGSCTGACLTLFILVLLRLWERPSHGPQIPVGRDLCRIALPLALGDVVKAGINTTENLMVPKRMALCSRIGDPLASFGVLSGMVFPILMFPACILFALAELLIPEMARCTASQSRIRICYLVKRSLKVAMLYGLVFGGGMYLLADPLCQRLYGNPEAGKYLKLYSLLVPMLYCDAITDAMTKGLGQQTANVRYNILTSAMDVLFLYLLLPRWGMEGYFVSFLITHGVNFALSLRRLLKITRASIPFYIPALSCAAAIASVWCISHLESLTGRIPAYVLLLSSLLSLLRIVGKEDILWIRGIVRKK